jgi:hypothetical protein
MICESCGAATDQQCAGCEQWTCAACRQPDWPLLCEPCVLDVQDVLAAIREEHGFIQQQRKIQGEGKSSLGLVPLPQEPKLPIKPQQWATFWRHQA